MVRKYKFNLFLKQIQEPKDFANIILIPVGLGLILELFQPLHASPPPAAWVSLPGCVQDLQSVNVPHPGRPPVSLIKVP
jgi:hypothetical protein